MKEIKSSITIQAPCHEVWQVLIDLENYHEWNPLFVQAKGTIAEGQRLNVKTRLPSTMLCGAPMSSSKSPKITKVDPNSYLEWTLAATSIKSVHYYQLTNGEGGKSTEFTQGERYDGWGAGFQSLENTRRGMAAMNNSLQLEVTRRREKSGDKNESDEKAVDNGDDIVAQLDISDHAAVAAAAAAGAFAPLHDAETDISENSSTVVDETAKDEENPEENAASTDAQATTTSAASEKPVEKRASIIGAVSSLFSSSRLSCSDRIQTSSSKEDLISSSIPEERENRDENSSDTASDDEEEEEDEEVEEDPVAKQLREAKNAERIVLDLGSGDMSLGDFGL